MSQHRPPNPATPAQIKRFRANPVEIAVFSVVALIFCSSVYNLLNDQQGFHPEALTPMAANPASEGRSPASVTQAFVNIDVRCDTNPDKDTTAVKVRITGSICGEGRSVASDSAGLIQTQVTNSANKFTATVFADTNLGKFSTDYIPLNMGKNPIHLEFSYRGGKTVTQDINVIKN